MNYRKITSWKYLCIIIYTPDATLHLNVGVLSINQIFDINHNAKRFVVLTALFLSIYVLRLCIFGWAVFDIAMELAFILHFLALPNRGIMLLRIVGNHLSNDTASYPTRP